MSIAINLRGQRFGRWLVLSPEGLTAAGKVIWRCECDCGSVGTVVGADLRAGKSVSCGCWRSQDRARRNRARSRSALERILARIEIGEEFEDRGRCWLVTAENSAGYATIKADGKRQRAHRLLYRELVGPIPPEHDLHHDCRVKQCGNPGHMAPLSRAEHNKIHHGAAT